MIATVLRLDTSDDGTFGAVSSDFGFAGVSGELPERGNAPGFSCILPGTYRARWLYSPKHKRTVPTLQQVPGRTDVEIHWGNVCGDVKKGLRSDILGCILVGKHGGLLGDQKAILKSKDAFAELLKASAEKDFDVRIIWDDTKA